MSDEGLMAEDIEGCMNVVLEALARKWRGLARAAEVIAWCSAMLENDRDGFIAREPLNRCEITSRRRQHDSRAGRVTNRQRKPLRPRPAFTERHRESFLGKPKVAAAIVR